MSLITDLLLWKASDELLETNQALKQKLGNHAQLLEQIRRSYLTPAERAAEDAERAAALARKQAQDIRRTRQNVWAGIVLALLVITMWLTGAIHMG